MFYGRERELDTLKKEYLAPGFRMVIVYGRRRVGKTEMLNRFAEGKRTIFFTATESSVSQNLEGLEQAVARDVENTSEYLHFRSFEDAFAYIGDTSKEEKQVVIIDEYPYLAESVPGISSVLQKCIDTDWQRKNILLILCGSSISFMEDEVLGSKSPLFGRRTAQLDVQPFDYRVSSQFVPDYSPEEKAMVHAVTGGVAKYLSLFDPEKTFDENVTELFFHESGYLYEEPKNLLRQEFRNIAMYNSVIEAIANGSVQMNEIAQKTGISTAALSQAFGKLIRVRILRKDIPILNEKNKRYAQYNVQDGMFRFWYRFVGRGVNAISRGYGKRYYEKQVKPYMHDFMGLIFEEMCQDYTFRLSMEGEIQTEITEIGKWRGQDNEKKQPADIDVVGLNRAEKTAVIGECKFRNELSTAAEIELLLDRSHLLPHCSVQEYLFFSLSGYEKKALEMQKQWPLKLYTIDDLY